MSAVERNAMPAAPQGRDGPVTVIRPSRGWRGVDVGELLRYRDLLLTLGMRDISVRYKQTALGVIWVVLQPALMVTVFSVVFGGLAKMPSDGLPYPVFAFCGLLPWQLFSQSFLQAGASLVNNNALITKVYFPRLIIPMAAVMPPLLDFAIGLLCLAALMAVFGIAPPFGIGLAMVPVFIFMAILTALAAGVWIAALTVYYRDFRYTLPFMVQFLMFATPVIYPVTLFPESVRPLLGINPMAGVIEGFRWALLDKPEPAWAMIAVSAVMTLALLLSGIVFFRKIEKGFADVI